MSRTTSKNTDEAHWMHCRRLLRLPTVPVHTFARNRMVIVAPHPDDEVLPVGGLLSALSHANSSIKIIAVTDGDASHNGSSIFTPKTLAHCRAKESARALSILGFEHSVIRRLHIADGKVWRYQCQLAKALRNELQPHDQLIAPWPGDGHPDHLACGVTARAVAKERGLSLHFVPIWLWHRKSPRSRTVPWRKMIRVSLDATSLAVKKEALRAFETQRTRDDSVADTPILPYSVIRHFERPFEVLIRCN